MAEGLPPAVRERLERAVWYDGLGTLSCFGQSWTVRTDDPELADLVGELFEPVRRTAGRDPSAASFSVLLPSDDEPGLVVRDAASVTYEGPTPGAVLSGLVWCINRLVIGELSGHLLLHATAAAKNSEVVLLVGRPNSGKTTLLTGLLQRGYDYVTDEVVSVDEDLWASGFPKPLTIDRGAWGVLTHLDPRAGSSRDRFHSQQWHLVAQRLATVTSRGRITAVAFPRYRAGAATSIQALSPGGAMAHLVPNVFAPEDVPLPLDRVRHLSAFAAAVPAYSITYGDWNHAIEELSSQLTRGRSRSARSRG